MGKFMLSYIAALGGVARVEIHNLTAVTDQTAPVALERFQGNDQSKCMRYRLFGGKLFCLSKQSPLWARPLLDSDGERPVDPEYAARHHDLCLELNKRFDKPHLMLDDGTLWEPTQEPVYGIGAARDVCRVYITGINSHEQQFRLTELHQARACAIREAKRFGWHGDKVHIAEHVIVHTPEALKYPASPIKIVVARKPKPKKPIRSTGPARANREIE